MKRAEPREKVSNENKNGSSSQANENANDYTLIDSLWNYPSNLITTSSITNANQVSAGAPLTSTNGIIQSLPYSVWNPSWPAPPPPPSIISNYYYYLHASLLIRRSSPPSLSPSLSLCCPGPTNAVTPSARLPGPPMQAPMVHQPPMAIYVKPPEVSEFIPFSRDCRICFSSRRRLKSGLLLKLMNPLLRSQPRPICTISQLSSLNDLLFSFQQASSVSGQSGPLPSTIAIPSDSGTGSFPQQNGWPAPIYPGYPAWTVSPYPYPVMSPQPPPPPPAQMWTNQPYVYGKNSEEIEFFSIVCVIFRVHLFDWLYGNTFCCTNESMPTNSDTYTSTHAR